MTEAAQTLAYRNVPTLRGSPPIPRRQRAARKSACTRSRHSGAQKTGHHMPALSANSRQAVVTDTVLTLDKRSTAAVCRIRTRNGGDTSPNFSTGRTLSLAGSTTQRSSFSDSYERRRGITCRGTSLAACHRIFDAMRGGHTCFGAGARSVRPMKGKPDPTRTAGSTASAVAQATPQ